jgi:hypothetical protein
VAVPFSGTWQGLQAPPQLFTLVVEAQVAPHWWKPALHATPQAVPSQVAAPLAGTAHAVHELPQLPVLVLDRHWLPQRW